MREATLAKDLIVIPHQVPSREVTQKDIKRVIKDGQLMFELCRVPIGFYKSAYAIAHPQITNKDPLRFFVTRDQWVVINPKIIRHTSVAIAKEEGCMSFAKEAPIKKERFYKCEVVFQTIDKDGNLTEPQTWACKGIDAQVVQHEIDHFNCNYLYANTNN